MASLQSLMLSDNELVGAVPAELASLTRLTGLVLMNNRLTAPPVDQLFRTLAPLAPSLESVVLAGNAALGGTLPAEVGTFTKLQHLALSGVGLRGALPAQLGALTSLTTLSLSGNELSGSVPPELGGLTNLTQLQLADNRLGGALFGGWGGLTKLSMLFLAGNSFTGAVPEQICDLVEHGALTDANNCVLDAPSQQSNSWACPLPACAAESCHAKCA